MADPLSFVTKERAARDADAADTRITFKMGPEGRQETFRLLEHPPVIGIMALSTFTDLTVETASGQDIIDAMGAIYEFLAEVMEPADFRRWRKLAARLGLDLDDLTPVMLGLVEAVYGLPTGPPSDSPPQSSNASRSSTAGWPSPAAATHSS